MLSNCIHDGKHYKIKDASELLNIKPERLQRAIQRGRLRALKQGREWQIRGDCLRKWVEQGQHSPGRTVEPRSWLSQEEAKEFIEECRQEWLSERAGGR